MSITGTHIPGLTETYQLVSISYTTVETVQRERDEYSCDNLFKVVVGECKINAFQKQKVLFALGHHIIQEDDIIEAWDTLSGCHF